MPLQVPLAAESISTRVQIVAIIASAVLLFFVLELLRRRRLSEPYAILWLLCSVVLLVLAVWNDLLEEVAEFVGIATPANALFAVAFGFILLLLLSFSVVVSRLTRENKVLAQEVARLNQERAIQAQAAPEPAERAESPIPR
jgi:hypothetical protein